MGANSSSFSDLATNDYLLKFSSTTPVSPQDPFWNQLLSYTFLIPINSSDAKLLEESTSLICKNLAINNCKTGNFGALIRTFLVRCRELKASAQCEDNIFTWQTYYALFIIRSVTYNALFIIRSVCKYLVEHLSEDLLIQQFDARPIVTEAILKKKLQTTLDAFLEDKEWIKTAGYSDPDGLGDIGDELMNALVELIVDVPVLTFTYALHLEALNTLLVLLSVQMYQPQPASKFLLYKYMMQGKWFKLSCV